MLSAQGFPVADVSEHVRRPGVVVWLDLLQPTERDMAVLVEELGLHPLAIEDALHAHQRPKLDRYSDHAFLAAYVVHEAPGEAPGEPLLQSGEIAAFVLPQALVTVRKSELVDLGPVLQRWDQTAAELAGCGVGHLVYGLLDVLVDGHAAAAAALDDEGEQLEDLLFEPTRPDSDDELQRRALALRRALTRLRRAAVPMREVIATLSRTDLGIVDARLNPYVRDVDDHVQRTVEQLDGLRDLLGTVLDVNLTLASNRLNQTIFRLTAYAAVLAVTTAITGYFGQNVPFPGFGNHTGLVLSTGLLLVSVTAVFALFKRRGWL